CVSSSNPVALLRINFGALRTRPMWEHGVSMRVGAGRLGRLGLERIGMTLPHGGSRLGTRFGPYELTSLIGVGGMGEVYRAYDTVKDRTVAASALRAAMDAGPTFQA